jgi:hypothetical protein
MYVDGRTLDLFAPFSREVGNPNRYRIRTQEQFEKFVYLNNGVSRDVFTSVYPSNHLIDKFFFDFDCSVKKYPDITMDEVFADFCTLISYLVDLGERPLPVVTGRKGYHLYISLSPSKASKQELWLATLCLLYESGLIWFDFDKDGKKEWHQSRAVDTTTIGDIEQLCRIPNTLRPPENDFWCTWLPLNEFDVRDMSVEDTFNWARRYHIRDDECFRRSRLRNFITRDMEFFEDFKLKHVGSVFMGSLDGPSERESVIYNMLSPFIPDSVIARVIHPEADHESRYITALAMLENGLSVDFTVSLMQQIGWNDFDLGYCRYQVQQVERNRGTRYRYKGNYGATLLRGKTKGDTP